MVIALFLAQLILPSPPSGPIQLPGMICASGGCEGGPVVYRTSAGRAVSDRLVVECDMTSDTCSDGRQIITTRPTPVPCEVAQGHWEMVGMDEGCYSVRGLESWASNISYLSWGAELDRWSTSGGGVITPLAHGYRLSGPVGSSVVQRIGNAVIDTEFTFTCILRGEGQAGLEFGGLQVITLSSDWAQYSRTMTISQGDEIAPRIYTGDGSSTADPVDIMGCWLTRTNTPGRPCWGGEAPVGCAGDWHTISTEGWPTKAGEIEITFTTESSSNNRYLFDSRTSTVSPTYGVGMYLTPTDELEAIYCAGDCSNRNKDAITLLPVNHVRYKWSASLVQVWLNGEEVLSWEPSGVIESHSETASLGSYISSSSNNNGSIFSFRVRSFE